MTSTQSDSRFWDRAARKYAASRIADLAGYERTLERTRALLTNQDRVLEFGCGTGMTALKLAPAVAAYIATDISGEMIAIGRERAAGAQGTNLEFAQAADSGGWPAGPFDAVLGFNVLHLVENLPKLLGDVHRVLKPGGRFVSKTPCIAEMTPVLRLVVPAMQLFRLAPHVSIFTGEALGAQLVSAGFSIEERARHGSGRKDARVFLVATRA
jgi:SAM-dependent methyltransferase